MAEPLASPTRLELTRRLPGRPERAFAAWTDPALLARWMSPFAAAEAQVDARVGGAFRIVMFGQGQAIQHTGTFVEFDPPRRLVFTWASPHTGPEPSLVSISFRPIGAETEMTLVHDRLPADQVESHAGGWGQILDHLATVLAEA